MIFPVSCRRSISISKLIQFGTWFLYLDCPLDIFDIISTDFPYFISSCPGLFWMDPFVYGSLELPWLRAESGSLVPNSRQPRKRPGFADCWCVEVVFSGWDMLRSVFKTAIISPEMENELGVSWSLSIFSWPPCHYMILCRLSVSKRCLFASSKTVLVANLPILCS